MPLVLLSCTQKIAIICFAHAAGSPPAASEYYPTSLLTFSFSISFEVNCLPLMLCVWYGHTFHPPKGQYIAACLSHQLINLCRLGSCYFIPESPCPKMPEILLPFHSLNQNWKLLSHSAFICQLAAACQAILLWIIWKASLGRYPQRGWEPTSSRNFGGGWNGFAR